MSNIMEYPVFEPDQVLTDEHLNGMFNYLDEQNRLTRTHLIGIGIVCGLHSFYLAADNTINITKGVGVTSKGYLIKFDGGKYTNAIKYTLPSTIFPEVNAIYGGIDMWQLLPGEEVPVEGDDVSLADTAFLRDKVVILFLEMNIINLKNCVTNDCDDKGKKAEFTIRPLLVNASDLSNFKYSGFESAKAALPDLVLRRYNIPFTALKTPAQILDAFYAITNSTDLFKIASAYENVYNTFKIMLPGEATNPFPANDLNAALSARLADTKNNNALLTQYFYDFIDDLVKAYNELREKGNLLLTECCPDENLFPYHLALCEALGDSRSGVSAYRNYFIYSPVFGEQKVLASELPVLFTRMKLLVNNFQLPDARQVKEAVVKITPSKYGEAWLSQRAIPYYYNVPALLNAWSYDKTRRGRATKNLSYHAGTYSTDDAVVNPLLYELEPYNFFRVEGHIGKDYVTALTAIVGQKQRFSLPFDVIALNVVANNNITNAGLSNCYFADLESLYNVLTAELLCKLHHPVCFLSRLPFIDLSRFVRTNSMFATADFTNAGTGATTASTSDAGNTMGSTSSATGSNAGFDFNNISELQNLVKTATKRTSLKVSLSVLYQLSQSFIDKARNPDTPYKKGDFLRHYCNPGTYNGKVYTVGQYYLEVITNNPGTTFPKPADLTANGNVNIYLLINYLYAHAFYFIDCVEELFVAMVPYYLYNLNFSNFSYRYQLVADEAADFGKVILTVLAHFQALNKDKPETRLEDFVEEVVINLIIDEMQMITHLCMDERIETLVHEYRKRLEKISLERIFSEYTRMHTGLDHKAGVTKGGTFIIVYEEKPARRGRLREFSSAFVAEPQLTSAGTAGITKEEAATDIKSTAFVAGEAEEELGEKEKEEIVNDFFELNRNFLSQAEFISVRQAFEKIRLAATNNVGYRIEEKIVFADFYLPYLCCSECTPISYIIQPAGSDEPNPEKPAIGLSANVICSNSDVPLTITVSPKGGTLSLAEAKQVNETTYQVAAKDLPAGNTPITYTLAGETATAQVTVIVAPDATFRIMPAEDALNSIQFISLDETTGLTHAWNFGDQNSPDNTSTLPHPIHRYPILETTAEYPVVHTVTSAEGCISVSPPFQVVMEAIVQEVTISVKKKDFCENQVEESSITVSPEGGELTGVEVQQIDATTYRFATGGLQPGVTTVTYSFHARSATDTITVHAAPSAAFTPLPVDGSPNIIRFTSADTNPRTQHAWDFGDPQRAGNNRSDEANPTHEYDPEPEQRTYLVTHQVSLDSCPGGSEQNVTVTNPPRDVRETRVFCADTAMPLEDPASVADASVLNIGELNPLFNQHQLRVDERLTLLAPGKINEIVNFSIRYKFLNNGSPVTKNVDVTILGINTGFQISFNRSAGEFVFTAAATNPQKVEWIIIAHNGDVRNGQRKLSDKKEFRISQSVITQRELVNISLNIVERQGQQECRDSQKASVRSARFRQMMETNQPMNFPDV